MVPVTHFDYEKVVESVQEHLAELECKLAEYLRVEQNKLVG